MELSSCDDAVTGWHIRNNLLLNANKTETIVKDTRQVAKSNKFDGILVRGVTAPFIANLRVSGVTLDSLLSFDEHIGGVVRACHYYMKDLRHIHPTRRPRCGEHCCVLHCLRQTGLFWTIFYEVSESNINRPQHVQNARARDVCAALYRSCATHLRQSLHWLSIMPCAKS